MSTPEKKRRKPAKPAPRYKVGELIEALKELNPDAEIILALKRYKGGIVMGICNEVGRRRGAAYILMGGNEIGLIEREIVTHRYMQGELLPAAQGTDE